MIISFAKCAKYCYVNEILTKLFPGGKMRRSLIIIALIALSTATFGYTAYTDIEYYPTGTAPQLEKNMLDIYVPEGATAGTPVIFFVHGGTWMFNDRVDFAAVGTELSDNEGYVVVIPSYRLSDSLHPENTHPCHIQDVAQAFAWTKDNITDYAGDPSKLIVMGHSAGGHLACLLSTNTYYLENAGAEISDIVGVVDFSMGIYDIPKLYADIGMFASMGYSMMGLDRVFGPIADSADTWYDASPKYHVSANTPPTVHFVTVNDMEHIIGGDFGGMGMVFLPGEIQFVYDDYNTYHPTDTFWIEGNHDTGFSNFVFEPTCRARTVTMDFIDDLLVSVEEAPPSTPTANTFCHPNPFNAACRIEAPGAKTVEIYNTKGEMVSSLDYADGEVIWSPGKEIPAGIYFVKAKANGNNSTTKITFIK